MHQLPVRRLTGRSRPVHRLGCGIDLQGADRADAPSLAAKADWAQVWLAAPAPLMPCHALDTGSGSLYDRHIMYRFFAVFCFAMVLSSCDESGQIGQGNPMDGAAFAGETLADESAARELADEQEFRRRFSQTKDQSYEFQADSIEGKVEADLARAADRAASQRASGF